MPNADDGLEWRGEDRTPGLVPVDQGEAETEYLRVAEVAALLHVSPRTVARWANERRVPHVRTLGGHRRFPRAVIERLAAGLRQDLRGPG